MKVLQALAILAVLAVLQYYKYDSLRVWLLTYYTKKFDNENDIYKDFKCM